MKRHINRLFTVMLAVLMIFAFSIIVSADSGLADDYTGKTVILSSNDVHGAIDGYAYMKALENELTERIKVRLLTKSPPATRRSLSAQKAG